MSTPRLLTAGACAVLAVVCSAPLARADLAEIRKAKVVRVLVVDGATDFFSKVQSPKNPGLEREILQSFCFRQESGINLQIRALPSATAVLQALQRGDGDVAAGGLMASEGAEVAFSAEVLPSRHVIVTWKRAHPVEKLEDLHDDRIGILRGTVLPAPFAGSGPLQGLLDDTFAPGSLLPALKAGKVTACILGVEAAIPAKAADPELQLGMYVGPKLSVAFALRKDEPQLRDALNEYVANLRRTATWNRLVLKYFGDSTIDILKASR